MALVLLVEDNRLNRKLLRDILEIEFEVAEAGSAEEAAEMIASQPIQLILLDMQLPGMDGLTFLRQLKEDPATRAIPVVAVSAHAMQEDIDRAIQAGCVEYVTKPIMDDPFEFVARMARHVAQENEHP